MIRVCVAGVTGWAARPVAEAVVAADDLRLVSGVARRAAGIPLAQVVRGADGGQVFGSVDEALRATPADVVVDYTSAAAVRVDVEAAVRAGVHVVVGSSGLTAEDFHQLDELARAGNVGVFAAGNFSVMAAVLARAARLAAGQLRHWEVVDYAGATKPDVPSGTARELAESLAEVGPPEPGVALDRLSGLIAARGADIAGTRVHSVRLPGYSVSTEIVFGGAGERLSLRHDAGASAEPYVAGTLLAVRRVGDEPGVRRGLGRLLFDD
ncbi:4-hydroxy-tetrahydrodipicolinate reductase [Nocardia thailandica]